MNMEDINTFICLTKTKNFSRTADILFTSQSNVSTRIKALEKELDKTLFLRTNKGVKLTPAGQVFLNYALQIYELYETGQQSLKISDKYNYQLILSSPQSFYDDYVIPAVDNLISKDLGFAIRLHASHSAGILQSLINNNCDVGISYIKPNHSELTYEPFLTHPISLVCRPDFKLPSDFLSPKTLEKYSLIYCEITSTFTEWLYNNYYSSIHFVETDSMRVAIRLLLNGKGVAFLPEHYTRPYLNTKQLIRVPFELSETIPAIYSYIVYKKSRIEILSPLLEELRKFSNF